MSRGDLRIYWGEARFIIDADDPRTAKILAMLVDGDKARAGEPKPKRSPPRCRDCDDTGLRRFSTGGFAFTVRAICACSAGDRIAATLTALAQET